MELTPIVTDSLKAEVDPVKIAASSIVISTPADVEPVRDFIRKIKERRDRVDDTFDKHIKAAHQAHKALVATKKTFTDVLDEAERIAKGKIGTFTLEQEKIAKEAAEKARLEAEAEQRRKIEAANKVIERAVGSSSKIENQIEELKKITENLLEPEMTRNLAERQIEVLTLKLQGLEDKAREAQQKAEQIAEAPAYIPPAAVQEKTAGVSAKKTYLVTVTDPMTLIKAIASGTGSAGLVKAWDETMIKKLALMGIFLPGVSYQEERTISVR